MDDFGITVHIAEAKHAMNRAKYLANRGAMYGVREAGRQVKQAAKRRAPVAGGTLKASIRSIKRLEGNATVGWTNKVAPMRSIKANQTAKKSGRTITDVVQYRRKEEATAHFMAAALAEVEPRLRDIHAKAWDASLRTIRNAR